MIRHSIKIFIPSNGQILGLTKKEEYLAEETQKKFISEGLIAWIIYTRGD